MKVPASKRQQSSDRQKVGKDAPFPTRETSKRRTEADVKKDGPFPHRTLSKDGPFPMWIRVGGGGPVAKDGPFPMLKIGLDWERIPFEGLYQGTRGCVKPTAAVVRSKNDLVANLPNIAQTGIDPDKIDFENEEVIIVGLGERPDNGYMVQIDEILYFTDRMKGRGPLTSVSYSEHRTTGRLDLLTYPVHVVKLRKLDGTEVEFDPA
jgi:hypothetical protein